MTATNTFIFTFLKIIAWIIFVGLCIEAGALLVNFFFSLYNPAIVQHLYKKLDLSALYSLSPWAFYSMYSFILVIAVLKAVLFYIIIKLVSGIDLAKPFNSFASRQVALISYYTLSIGLLSFIARQSADQLQKYGFDTDNLQPFWTDSQAFILMAGVTYVVATIFKRGLELQNESDLTV